jgi:hypothetical protein
VSMMLTVLHLAGETSPRLECTPRRPLSTY